MKEKIIAIAVGSFIGGALLFLMGYQAYLVFQHDKAIGEITGFLNQQIQANEAKIEASKVEVKK